MKARRVKAALASATALAAGLGGCVSLLPKQAPVQLYQFGRVPTPLAQAGPEPGGMLGRGGPVAGVILSQVTMPRAALGDGVLTVRGDQAAYLAGARWLTPAVLMFQEDVQGAFEAQARSIRLIDRSQPGSASALLRLDVTEFDARYDPATQAPPTVVVSLRATLSRADGRELVQQVFTSRRPATEDRVSAIVSAYDAAVDEVLGQVVGWTQAKTPALAADLDPDAPTALPPPLGRRPPPGSL